MLKCADEMKMGCAWDWPTTLPRVNIFHSHRNDCEMRQITFLWQFMIRVCWCHAHWIPTLSRLRLIGYCSLKPGRHSEILCQKTKKKARRLGGGGQERWEEGQEKSVEFDPGLKPTQQSKDPTWPVVMPSHSWEVFKGLGKHCPS